MYHFIVNHDYRRLFFHYFFIAVHELHDCIGRLEELKQMTSWIIKSTKDHVILLKHIDSPQRSGLAYHFEDEIREAITRAYHLDIATLAY